MQIMNEQPASAGCCFKKLPLCGKKRGEIFAASPQGKKKNLIWFYFATKRDFVRY